MKLEYAKSRHGGWGHTSRQDKPRRYNFDHNHDDNVELIWVFWYYITSKTFTNKRKAFSAVKYMTLFSTLVFTQIFHNVSLYVLKQDSRCNYVLTAVSLLTEFTVLFCLILPSPMKYEWSYMHIHVYFLY